jgi:hypothetical protein
MELLKIKLLTDEKVLKESLSRIGIQNKKEKILYPSAYLYKENDEYFLVHFKELFMLKRPENSYNNMSEQDIERKNAIAYCLKQWGLIDVDENNIQPHNLFVYVLPFKEKKNWTISHKVNLFMTK